MHGNKVSVKVGSKHSVAHNEADLQALVQLLTRCKTPMVVREIAFFTDCSKVIAYKRIRTLEKRGYKFEKGKLDLGRSGPSATTYKLKGLPNGEKRKSNTGTNRS